MDSLTDESYTRNAFISVRMAKRVKEAAEKAARDDCRTLSSLLEKTLVERLERDGYLPK